MKAWILVLALLGAVALLGAGFWLLRPGSTPIIVDYYRIADEDTIIIGTAAANGSETRVTDVIETADSVTIIVRRFDHVFGPTGGVTYSVELTVELERPLGDRGVFGDDHAVPEMP